jgi:hypothetical protein
MSMPVNRPVICLAMGGCAPKRSGLHLGNVDYDNALAVAAAHLGAKAETAIEEKEEVGVTDGLFEKR